jgi:hypothetical protein
MPAPKCNLNVEETTRQNLCQIRGQAFRKIARQVIRQIDGEDEATDERVRILAKNEQFQELVGQMLKEHWKVTA